MCCVGSMCVVLGPAVSADWLPSCAPAACVSVAVERSVTCIHVPKWNEAELALPRRRVELAVSCH